MDWPKPSIGAPVPLSSKITSPPVLQVLSRSIASLRTVLQRHHSTATDCLLRAASHRIIPSSVRYTYTPQRAPRVRPGKMTTTDQDTTASSGRLLLISNRLPITIKRSEDGQYSFSMSSGGLVTGLSGLSKATKFQWYGWPGLEVPEAEEEPMRQRLLDEYGAVPVFVEDELADRHYNGFASKQAPTARTVPRPASPRMPLQQQQLMTQPPQTQSCGRSSTTTPVRSHSTSRPGLPIRR